MSAKHSYWGQSGNYSISEIYVNDNSFYSLNNDTWNKFNGTNIISNTLSNGGSITLYILKNNTTISIKISNLKLWNSYFKISTPNESQKFSYSTKYESNISTFEFSILDNNAVIKWDGDQGEKV